MSGIRALLGRSRTIRTLYAAYQREYCRTYRRVASRLRAPSETCPDWSDATPTRDELTDEAAFPDTMRLVPHPEASNPVLTRDDIDDAVASFVADPFVVYVEGTYHMFFEIKNVAGDVFIGHAYSDDGLAYTYNRIVLGPETAQHTFPYVFPYDDTWLMVPSPGSDVNGQFRIYRAVSFPTEWELVSVPIETGVRQDPTPIRWNGYWYLIYQDVESMDIHLWFTDTLTGSRWREHPDSPIFENDIEALEQCDIGRAEMVPSGRPLYRDDGVDIYYRSHLDRVVHQYRIEELSPARFSQRLVTGTVFGDEPRDDWNGRFMHTVNPVFPWNRCPNIVAVDGLEANSYTYSIGIYTVE